MTGRLACVAGSLALASTGVTGQVVFRSTVDSVAVDVSVEHDGRTVSDLTAADFEIRDNGQPQRILDLTREELPIDLTFVVDLSDSVRGPLLEALTRSVTSVAGRLRPVDRSRIIAFNHQVHELHPMSAGGLPPSFRFPQPSGRTSLFDAVALALVAPHDAGRRQMTMVFTDGLDSTSFLDGPHLVELARRSESAVFSVAAAGGTAKTPVRAPHAQLFEALAEATGGMSVVLQRDRDLGASFTDAFERFRTSYVLRYTYDGRQKPGWHTIEVRVLRRGDHRVRAKQGYFAR